MSRRRQKPFRPAPPKPAARSTASPAATAPSPAEAQTGHPAAPATPLANTAATALLSVVLALLTPVIAIAGLSPDQTALAAQQALDSYAGNPIQTGQAAAFGLSAMDDLRLAAPEDLPLTMKLKLRGNANALTRNSLRHAQPATTTRPDPTPTRYEPDQDPDPEPRYAQPEAPTEAEARAKIAETIDLYRTLPPVTDAKSNSDRQWASIMIGNAQELLDELKSLPPEQHNENTQRIKVICGAVREIVTGEKLYPDA